MEAQKTWKPKVAGILDIVAGATCFIIVLVYVLASLSVDGWNLDSVLIGVLIFVIAGCIWGLAIVGGIHAIKRKRWGLALAGSIAAIPFVYIGILAVIFIAFSKDEFE